MRPKGGQRRRLLHKHSYIKRDLYREWVFWGALLEAMLRSQTTDRKWDCNPKVQVTLWRHLYNYCNVRHHTSAHHGAWCLISRSQKGPLGLSLCFYRFHCPLPVDLAAVLWSSIWDRVSLLTSLSCATRKLLGSLWLSNVVQVSCLRWEHCNQNYQMQMECFLIIVDGIKVRRSA